MANIELQHGKEQQVDVTLVESGSSASVSLNSGYSAELVIRRKAGKSFRGEVVDTLTSANSRIVLLAGGSTWSASTGDVATANINLKWNTAQALALPNVTTTVYGDLRVANNATFADGQVKYHIRLTFDLIESII